MLSAYERTLSTLARYLSRVNAELMLGRALRRMELTPHSLTEAHLHRLVSELERGLNLFVERERIPQLIAQLRNHEERPVIAERVVAVADDAGLSEARLAARVVCQELGAAGIVTQKVATLVSELARNIILYANKGRIELSPALDPKRRIIVRAIDSGPGIANLEQILSGGYKSKTGLGMGLRGCKRLARRFDVQTGDWGTRVEAEIDV